MTDGQWLFAVFSILYVLECLRWLPLQDWLGVEKGRGRWSYVRPSKTISARGLGLVVLPPFPPFRAHLTFSPWHFIPNPDHLDVVEEEGRVTRHPWADLRLKTEGSQLFIGAQSAVRLRTEEAAREWSRRLREWAETSAEARENAFLDFAKKTLDEKALAAEAQKTSKQVRSMNVNAALILFWCFGVVTAIYTAYGETNILWASVIVLLGLQLFQAFLFWRATRPAANTPPVHYRFWKALIIALMPHFSIRAADHLCQARTFLPHPLAARDLVESRNYHAAAEKFWRWARFSKGWPKREKHPIAAEALARHFCASDIQVSEFETPPPRDPTSRSYCPRCLTLFEIQTGECRDCQGTELRAFEGDPEIQNSRLPSA